MEYDLVVSGGTLVLPEVLVSADLGVTDGRIAAIGTGLRGRDTLSARGTYVLPGLVDPHVHPIHAETYQSVSEAAIHGGVTTTVHHLYTPPEGDPVPFVAAAIAEAEGASLLDFSFHIRLNDLRRTHASIAGLVALGCPSIKLFMAYGGRIMVDDDELLIAMAAAGAAGGMLLIHAENGHAAARLEAAARARGAHDLPAYYASRPRWVEIEAVERALHLVRMQRCPTYLVHLTCRESLEAVTRGKLEGLPVFAETCPHYLLLTADTAAHLGARAKMAPPLRDRADQDALWHGLAAGLIDTVGTDHSAFAREEKEASHDVFDAGFGVPGLATMLPLLFDRGVRAGRITLPRLITALAAAPARILGLSDRKGSLAVGADADFVLFDPQAPFVIDSDSEHGHSYYSLYEGWQGHGVVLSVHQRGEPLYADGEVLASAGRGRHLARVAARPTP